MNESDSDLNLLIQDETGLEKVLCSAGIVLLDTVKTVPFAKAVVDRKNYSKADFVVDVCETLMIASLAKYHVPRLGVDNILLGASLAVRFYKEMKHDLATEFQNVSHYLEQKIGHNSVFSKAKGYYSAAERVLYDGYSHPMAIAGWALANGLLMLNLEAEKNPTTLFNISTVQHFLVTYGSSNALMRFAEEIYHERYGAPISRSAIKPFAYLGVMVLAVFGWEAYEKYAMNYKINWDTAGDVIMGFVGWGIPIRMTHERVMELGKEYIGKIGGIVKGTY